MSLASISRFVLRHKLALTIFWIVALVAGIISTGPATDALSMRFDLPGSESTGVNTEIAQTYGSGGFGRPWVMEVTLPEGTTADDPAVEEQLTSLLDQVKQAAPAVRIVSYASTGDQVFVSDDGQTTFALIYPVVSFEGPSPGQEPVENALADATIAGAEVHVSGLSSAEAANEDEGGGVLIETLIGAGGALVVLLWVFGSFLAVLPVVIAGFSILTCFLLILGLTTLIEVNFTIQFLIALIGLGVAIDYSLLLVTRWREERSHTDDNALAVQRATETAGHAVVFSGTTVAISLLALVAIPVPFIRSIGLGGMLIPVVSVAVAITLLPVILATIGPRLDWPRLRKGNQVSRSWERWTSFVVHHRVVATIVGFVVVIAIAIPALSLNLASPVANAFAEKTVASQALDEAGFAEGVTAPYEVLVKNADPATVAGGLASVDGVVGTVAPDGEDWRRGDSAIVLVFPETDASSGNGAETVGAVRDAADALPGSARVGGQVAADVDFIDAVYGNFVLAFAIILAVTFVLLVRAFRSIVLPLKAVLLNVLSVGAAYGVLVLIWQEGYGSGLLFGAEATGAIPNWLPLSVFSFLFGLSMDYEVFILTRMREEYDRTGSTSASVVRGMSHTGRLVTTAAVILFLAFVSMSTVPEVDVQIMATGLAAGILIDATVIRGLLVPAIVALMGHWNWWLPSWLEWFVPSPPRVTGSDAAAAD